MRWSPWVLLGACSVLGAPVSWAQQAVRFDITGYAVDGATLLSGATVQSALAPHIGAGKEMKDVQAAADALRRAYEEAGYPVVQVFPPEQQLSGGSVMLRVMEGTINSVQIKGNQQYDAANIRASLPPLQEGIKPNVKDIIAAIAAANENPAKQVAVNFQAAQQPGQIDAMVNVTEDRSRKFTASVDNAGSKSVGVHRLNLGYQDANLFDRDHMVTAQVSTSLDLPQKTLSLTGGYRVPLYAHGLSLDLMGAYSKSNATTPVGFGSTQFSGQGTMFGLRLNQPLPSVGEFRHKLIYGLDYKDFDNTCKGTGAGKCGTITTQPVSLTYFAQLSNPAYQISGSASLVSNLPGGPNGGLLEYHAARDGASYDWYAWRFAGNFGVPLSGDWQFRSALNGQMTGTRLVGGEQFGLGGASSVRGYTERVATGDSGYSVNLELYTPDFGPQLSGNTGLRALVFYDSGRVYYSSARNGERQVPLSSIGTGLRANLGRDVSAKLDIGFVQEATTGTQGSGTTRSRGDSFAHISVNLAF